MPTHNKKARRMLQATRTRLAESIRITLVTVTVTGAAIGVLACSKGDGSGSNGAPAAGKITTSVPQAGADTDHAVAGASLPTGYSAVFDHANAKSADVSYSEREPGKWEVKTGPAHILFASKDTALNKYSVSATFEQLDAPAHPEAFGVFIGGSSLDTPTVKYSYFIVRGDGKYMVKVRDGSKTRTITDWTASPAIPKQDAAGKGLYGLKIDVKDGAASVSVNGAPVTTLSGKDVPLNGIAGVRINHNLHLLVTPVSVIR
jgi:hypothetical protein